LVGSISPLDTARYGADKQRKCRLKIAIIPTAEEYTISNMYSWLWTYLEHSNSFQRICFAVWYVVWWFNVRTTSMV
jgi:hypothetical protein